MDEADRLRLDYDQTTQYLRALEEIRFRLLAFVPTIATAAVGLLGRLDAAEELFGVGLLGLAATLGILVYELRSAQIMAAVEERARELERMLALTSVSGAAGPVGLVAALPARRRILGFLEPSHRGGVALVYAAALAGWGYVVAWAALAALEAPEPRGLGGLAGVVAGIAAFGQIFRALPPSD